MLTKIIAIKPEKVLTPLKMIKRGLKKDMTHFLQTPNKILSKKKRQINKSKQKASLKETNSRKAIISNLNSLNKKELPVSIPTTIKSKPKAGNIDIAIINTNVYYVACCLKRTQVFAKYIRNINYQFEKEARAKTNLRNVVF